MHGKSRDRGYPLIGNQHDPGAALFGGSGKFQHAGVIAADIEEHHDIALADVERHIVASATPQKGSGDTCGLAIWRCMAR